MSRSTWFQKNFNSKNYGFLVRKRLGVIDLNKTRKTTDIVPTATTRVNDTIKNYFELHNKASTFLARYIDSGNPAKRIFLSFVPMQNNSH